MANSTGEINSAPRPRQWLVSQHNSHHLRKLHLQWASSMNLSLNSHILVTRDSNSKEVLRVEATHHLSPRHGENDPHANRMDDTR